MKSKFYKEVCKKSLSHTCVYKIIRCLNKLGYGGYTIEDFAEILPTTQSLRMRSFIDKKYFLAINRQYWKRVNQGIRTVRDADLIQRIENGLGVMMSIDDNPLFKVLGNNLIKVQELQSILEKIKNNLDERVFYTSKGEHKDKQIYWSYKNTDLVNNENFLAYQLLLMNRNWNIKNIRHPCIKDVVLFFWRVLIIIPMGKLSEALCEIFFNYLIINIDIKIPDYDENTNYFVKLRNIAFPNISQHPDYTNSFELYREYHDQLYEKSLQTMNNGCSDYFGSFRSSVFYWADRYADRWMRCEINKSDLFNQSSPEFSEIYKGVRCLTRHRIW